MNLRKFSGPRLLEIEKRRTSRYIEFVTLDDFGRRVIVIVMCLIVFIPLVARVHAVEKSWLPWPEFIVQ